MAGVLIATLEGRTAIIDTMLLSCRALGRELEKSFVLTCLKMMNEEWSNSDWTAAFVPTTKNSQVRDFWPSLGFEQYGENDNEIRYFLDASIPDEAPPEHIQVIGS